MKIQISNTIKLPEYPLRDVAHENLRDTVGDGRRLLFLMDVQSCQNTCQQWREETLCPTEYVQKQQDVYRIAGTRVSLDLIVYAWWAGQSAETITQSFPVLTLEQVYGAITFYLTHREEVDRYLAQQRAEYEAKRQAARDADPMFYQKMAKARRQLLSAP